jgi:hypothetical protein
MKLRGGIRKGYHSKLVGKNDRGIQFGEQQMNDNAYGAIGKGEVYRQKESQEGYQVQGIE